MNNETIKSATILLITLLISLAKHLTSATNHLTSLPDTGGTSIPLSAYHALQSYVVMDCDD